MPHRLELPPVILTHEHEQLTDRQISAGVPDVYTVILVRPAKISGEATTGKRAYVRLAFRV